MADSLERSVVGAHGYLGLGMLDEAREILVRLPQDRQGELLVVSAWVELFSAERNWPQMREMAAALVELEPHQVQGWVALAFATRRSDSIESARQVLRKALELHPREAIIEFNLGCYACQLGELDLAKSHVLRSIRLEKVYLKIARQDPDLQPLWNDLKL